MRACLVTVAVILVVAAAGSGQAVRKSVMVVDFEDLVQGWTYTREVVTAKVIARLREEATLRVIPRDRVQEALRAANVERAGLLDVEDAQKVAKELGADYVVMGQIVQFDQQYQSVWAVLTYVHTATATVKLRGKVLDTATGQFTASPEAESRKQQGGVSAWVGPWWTHVSVSTFDAQLIGKATQEAVERFVEQAKAGMR